MIRSLAFTFCALAGCATAQPSSTFDADLWLREAVAVLDSANFERDPEGTRIRSRQLARQLDDVVEWTSACGEEGAREALESSDPPPAWSTIGWMNVYPLGADEHFVEITCNLYPYQESFAGVLIRDGRARLLRFPNVDEEGNVTEGWGGYVGFGGPTEDRQFHVFTKAAGYCICGMRTTYRIGEDGAITVVEARSGEDDPNTEADDETPWPRVYPRE